MERERFQRIVLSAWRKLPGYFRRKLSNVAVVVEDWPPAEEERGTTEEDELLGLYHGYPLKERGTWYGNVLPDRIVIYQGPIEKGCRSEREVFRRVEEVLLHEVGHYFGLEEEELRAIEELEGEDG